MTQTPFDAPAAPGGGKYPTMRQLSGRLLVIFPKTIETVPDSYNQGQMKERLTADVVFLDGDPITQIEKQNAAPEQLEQPIRKGDVMTNMFISQSVILGQVKGRKRVLGRLGQGQATKGNPPWVLAEQTPADQELALRWWTKVGQAAFEGAGAPSIPTPPPAPAAAPTPPPAPAAPVAVEDSEPF